jgi:hypothetical protein
MGLSLPLDGFGFEFLPGQSLSISFNEKIADDPLQWRLWLLRASDAHKVALAVKEDSAGGPFHITLREMTPMQGHAVVPFRSIRQK